MADFTSGKGQFTAGETVSARKFVGAAAQFTAVAAADGSVAFTAAVAKPLDPNREYFLTGGTSGRVLKCNTSDELFGAGFLTNQFKVVTISYDVTSFGNAAVASQNVTVPAGTIDVGDIAIPLSRSGTESFWVVGVGPIVTKDVLPLQICQQTGASLDPATQTFRFLVIRARAN